MRLHGDCRFTGDTARVHCHKHGTVEVPKRSWPSHFRLDHKKCLPMLNNTAQVKELARSLASSHSEVSVFWDRCWGDSGLLEISVVTGGDGANPRAGLSESVYRALQEQGVVGPNVLNTFKSRRLHHFN